MPTQYCCSHGCIQWGNDREVLTTDGDESVGNFAAGKAERLSPDGTNLTLGVLFMLLPTLLESTD